MRSILAKVPYSQHPPRFDYTLTAKGRDLWPVITAMRQWGDSHVAPDGPPLQLIHRDCGGIADAHMACSVCGEAIDAGNVKTVPGPGAVEPLIGSAWRAEQSRLRVGPGGSPAVHKSQRVTAPVAEL